MCRVLIVEDEAINALYLEHIIQNLGGTVCATYKSGEKAVENIEVLAPDLVLMDIFLAGEIDGIRATREIHKIIEVPVIYITASSDPETYERAAKTRMSDFIRKPFQDEEIERAIKNALPR